MLETVLLISIVVLIFLILAMIGGSIIVAKCVKDCPLTPEEFKRRKNQ